MIQRDKEATKARGFKDSRSKVLKDGREILYHEDWDARKWELWQRAGGICEFTYENGERCCQEAQIPSHIEPRYPSRDDRMSNLLAQCMVHDRLTEKQSWRRTRWGEKHEDNAGAQATQTDE